MKDHKLNILILKYSEKERDLKSLLYEKKYYTIKFYGI